jgi:uncharacterized RDD family membrane protein YckC
MSWYYASGGQQQGPVDDAQFENMIQAGQIKPADLVWKEGMANWQPLSTVRPDVLTTASAAVPMAASVTVPPVVSSGLNPDEITCVECGGRFTKDNAIQYGSTWVCASCKPVFVQKLKEGAAVGATAGVATMNYAGFWIRFVAKLIDNLIIGAVISIPMVVLIFGLIGSAASSQKDTMGPLVAMLFNLGIFGIQLVWILVMVAYNTFFIGKFGATPGKMAVGLKIVTAEGLSVPMLRAFGRAWAEQLSSCILNIGYIIAAFDPEKRALHDHICNTRVIFK